MLLALLPQRSAQAPLAAAAARRRQRQGQSEERSGSSAFGGRAALMMSGTMPARRPSRPGAHCCKSARS